MSALGAVVPPLVLEFGQFAVLLEREHGQVDAVAQRRAERRGDAEALVVQVAAHLHGVARLALVGVVVGRRLYQQRVLAL